MTTLINGDDFVTYNTLDMAMVTKVLREISNKAKAVDGGNVTVTIPQNPDLNIPMWLVTDKDGSTRIIKCSEKPFRDTSVNMWAPGSGDHEQASIDSPFSAKFFGMFWRKAAEELRKMGLPKWEDDPVEIEVSRIKINYY